MADMDLKKINVRRVYEEMTTQQEFINFPNWRAVCRIQIWMEAPIEQIVNSNRQLAQRADRWIELVDIAYDPPIKVNDISNVTLKCGFGGVPKKVRFESEYVEDIHV